MEKLTTHWTNRSTTDFVYRVSSDFVIQLETKLEKEAMNHKQFAELVGHGESRVSQIMNNPGNLSLSSIVKYARALGMKVAIVAYDDEDPDNHRGPIASTIFEECWNKAGRPKDFFELRDVAAIIQSHGATPPVNNDAVYFQVRAGTTSASQWKHTLITTNSTM
jgi:predicted XRE-type DNA-binding protein